MEFRPAGGIPRRSSLAIHWSHGYLFEEEAGASGSDVLFRYPARRASLASLGPVFIVIALAAAFFALWPEGRTAVIIGASFLAFVQLAHSLWEVWTQRMLVIEREARTISLHIKSPFGRRRRAYPFDRIQAVIVEFASREPDDPTLALSGRVYLALEEGMRVWLGEGDRSQVLAFGRRISELTGAPVAADAE